jgi:Uma2 family endonuclease
MVTTTSHESIHKQIEDIALLRPLTAGDLRTLPDDGNRYEIIGGKLFVSPSPTSRHQVILTQLTTWLNLHVIQRGLGRVIVAPMDVHLSANDVVQPDLLVVLNESKEIVCEHGIVGPPDLVVEILSPSTMTADFIRKAELYALHGVREYWIVDPVGETIIVQTLEGNRFIFVNEYGAGDTLRSPLLDDLALELALVFQVAPAEPTAEQSESTHPEDAESTDDK